MVSSEFQNRIQLKDIDYLQKNQQVGCSREFWRNLHIFVHKFHDITNRQVIHIIARKKIESLEQQLLQCCELASKAVSLCCISWVRLDHRNSKHSFSYHYLNYILSFTGSLVWKFDIKKNRLKSYASGQKVIRPVINPFTCSNLVAIVMSSAASLYGLWLFRTRRGSFLDVISVRDSSTHSA